jgi:hypothetical protein
MLQATRLVQGVCEATTRYEFRDAGGLVALPGGPDSLLIADVAQFDTIAEVFIGKEAGVLASRVGWSPDERPTQDCWAVVGVERHFPAVVAIGPYDGHWYRCEVEDLPWFLAATAGGIRGSIEKGQPIEVRSVGDRRLFGRVVDGDPPPADEQGRI